MKCKAALLALLLVALAPAAWAATPCTLGQIAELPVTMMGLEPTVPVKFGGRESRLKVDSGGFFTFMGEEAARDFGLSVVELPAGFGVRGLGGQVYAHLAKARNFEMGPFKVPTLDFITTPRTFDGEVVGLLGQNFLNAYDVEYDLGAGVIRLFEPQGDCAKTPRAYWGGAYSVLDLRATSFQEPHLRADVKVNGQLVHAMFDTGAALSMLDLKTAARLGIKPNSPGVTPVGSSHGLDGRDIRTWSAPISEFVADAETIKATRMLITETELDFEREMILGADFFLAHRIYVSTKQHKIYLSYSGGPVFRLAQSEARLGQKSGPETPAPTAPPPASSGAAAAAASTGSEPTDAAGFERRGNAFAARGDFVRALADLDKAVAMEPKVSGHYYERARVRMARGGSTLAMADLHEALTLKPNDARALALRGRIYLMLKDEARAKADFDAALAAPPTAGEETRLTVAGAYAATNRYDIAVEHVDRWIADHPQHAGLVDALNTRCWYGGLSGQNLEAALAACNKAVGKDHIAAYLDSRGLVYLRMGRLDQAISDYDTALKQTADLPWSRYMRGLAKQKKGLKAEGDADIAAAVARDATLPKRAADVGLVEPPKPAAAATP